MVSFYPTLIIYNYKLQMWNSPTTHCASLAAIISVFGRKLAFINLEVEGCYIVPLEVILFHICFVR